MERQLLEKVAERLPQEAGERLLSDMSVAVVAQAGDFLQVELTDYERPQYTGHSNLSFEGKLNDTTGGPVSILVNVDQNDRLLEIETIWWSSDNGTDLDWHTLEIVPTDRKTW